MKYLAIDIGNVICEVNFLDFIESSASLLDTTKEDIYRFLYTMQKANDIGILDFQIAIQDYYDIQDNTQIKLCLDRWNDTVKTNVTMISFLKSLLQDNFSIALLSNIGYEHKALLPNLLKDIYTCDKGKLINWFSCEIGARKPTYLYYKTFLDIYPEFINSVYIDDRIENLEASKLFGFEPYYLSLDEHKSNLDVQISNVRARLDI
jgi:FMN phosphatase YigB (HAD superfamily)